MTHEANRIPRATARAHTSAFVQGNKDPAKMTHTIMVLVERGLGAKRAGGNHSQEGGRRWLYGSMHDAHEGIEVEGSKRQGYPLVAPP